MFVLLWIPLLAVLYWLLKYLWYERYLRKFAGPTPLPILGSALDFASAKDRLYRFLEYQAKYKGDFKMYLGFEPFLCLTEPKSIEVILNSTTNLKKSKQYDFLKNWLGNGLLLSDGDYWRRHRKIITPAFHFQILEKYVEAFNASSDVLVQQFKEKVNQGAFDIFPFITLCALDIMCESAMGTSVNAQLNSDSKYVKAVKEIGQIIIDRGFSVLQQFDFIYKWTTNYRKELKILKTLHSYAYDVMDKKKRENKDIKTDGDISSKEKLAFLDLLLYHNSKTGSLSDAEIREEVDTLLFEGHDTTASGITFTLYCLANNQIIQEKAYQEIESIFADDPTRSPTYKDLNDMKYLEKVIKESLRIYPPVALYGRKLITDVQCGDKILPKGITIGILALGIQRDPTLFPNPDVFDPERFSVENSTARNPYIFIPFSAGPRNCIGQKFAMLEMKSTISKVLRHYKVLPTVPAQKIELVLETVMKPKNGVLVHLQNR